MEYYTVGPVEMFPRTLRVRAKQIPYFRTPEFSQVVLDCEASLKALTGAPESASVALLTSSGTGAMEAVIMSSFVPRLDRVIVVDGGTFGHRFVELCRIHGIPHDVVGLSYGEVLTVDHLERALRPDTTGLLLNIHETSTGQLYDAELVSSFARENGLYLVVDAISSFLADPLDFTVMGVDALILSSQKGLALAPGLSPIVMSERLRLDRVADSEARTMYFDLEALFRDGRRGQTPFTPAVGIIYELQDMLIQIEEVGLDTRIEGTRLLAEDFREKACGAGLPVPGYPLSNALTPVQFPKGNAMEAFHHLIDRHEIYVNPTGGPLASTVLRVAHVGNHDASGNTQIVEALAPLL